MNISPQRKKIAVAAAVALIGVGTAFYHAGKSKLPKGFASGNGRIEATSVDIVSKFSARIAEVLAKEGDTVKKDQVLARLDTKDLAAQYRQAQAQVQQARQEKNYAKAVVVQRKSELSLAGKSLARSKSLYVNQSIALKQLQEDETAVDTAKAALAAAEAQVTKAEASILAAGAQADSIKASLDDSDLRSPIDGRILYRTAEPGEVVNVGGNILTVLDLTDVYMTIFLPTDRAGLVALGAEARIVLDAAPDRPIPAQVTFVEPRAQFTPKQVETQSERESLMFRVKVNVDPAILKKYSDQVKTGLPGMAYVRIDKNAAWPPHLAGPDLAATAAQ